MMARRHMVRTGRLVEPRSLLTATYSLSSGRLGRFRRPHDLSDNTYEPGSTGRVFDVGLGAFRVYVVGFRPVSDSAGNCDFAPVQVAGVGDPAVQDYPTIDYKFRNSGGLACAL